MITTTATDLAAAKSDLPALLAALDLTGQRPSNHHKCRFCGDRTGLSVYQTEAGWRFRCHCCGVNGTVIDALVLTDGLPAAEVCRRLAGSGATSYPRSTPRPALPTGPVIPVPDRERLDAYQCGCIGHLVERNPVAVKYAKRRGLDVDVLLRFCVGFDPGRQCWAFPIEHGGNIVATKLHREDPPPDVPKSGWATFGTLPPEKPKHGLATFFPVVEAFPKADPLFLFEGELKALAAICAGRAATAPTAGAGFTWRPWHLERLRGRRVAVVFDDDAAGLTFRDKTLAALQAIACELRAVTFGRMVNRD
jgi:hypothetical protein